MSTNCCILELKLQTGYPDNAYSVILKIVRGENDGYYPLWKHLDEKKSQIEAEEENLIQILKNFSNISQNKMTHDDKKDLARYKER